MRTLSSLIIAVKRRLEDLRFRPKRRFYLKALHGKNGLEIGGPSQIFTPSGLLPAYPEIGSLDGCNFNAETVWSGKIQEGLTYDYLKGRANGRQYICEASDLNVIASEQYDFLLACHVLEHVANPLKALTEWIRVIKPGGIILLVLPDKGGTFDHKRPTTTLQHLIDDHEKGTDETDLSHLPEILERHDLSRDPRAGSADAFRERSLENHRNRCLHHHVFDRALAVSICERLKLRVLADDFVAPMDIFLLAQKQR
jgi:SAM-dependent methyltransferase